MPGAEIGITLASFNAVPWRKPYLSSERRRRVRRFGSLRNRDNVSFPGASGHVGGLQPGHVSYPRGVHAILPAGLCTRLTRPPLVD